MRKNAFGDPYIQPGDDFIVVWMERFGDTPADAYARFIEVSEDDGLWGAEVADNEDGDKVVYLEGFETEEELKTYLREFGIDL